MPRAQRLDLLKLTEVEAFETKRGEIEELTLLMDLATAFVPESASPANPISLMAPSVVDVFPNARALLANPVAKLKPKVTVQGVVHVAVGAASMFAVKMSDQITPIPNNPSSRNLCTKNPEVC